MLRQCICPACGFDYKVKVSEEGASPIIDDYGICRAWAHLYMKDAVTRKLLPTKEQFEAMQREGFLPTVGGDGERTWKIWYGHYGWAVDYQWFSIADSIIKRRKEVLISVVNKMST